MSCKYCGKEINNKGSLASHELRCKQNPDAVEFKNSGNLFRKGKEPWNKGLTKESSPKIAEAAEKSSRTLKGRKGHKHTDASKQRLREVALERGLGGYQEKSGRGKKGRYQGIWCDSSWELAFVIYCLDHGVKVERSLIKRTYVHNGEKKVYLPDFLVDGKLVEIKGYKTEEWEAKLRYNPDVTVYGKDEMKPIIEWVKEKYGPSYTDLYEEKHFTVKPEKQPKPKVRKEKVKKPPGKVGGHNALSAEEVKSRLSKVSGVDFTKFGWVEKVARTLGVSHTHARRFINKHYSGEVYTRKSPLN